jgi:hypothetical protein
VQLLIFSQPRPFLFRQGSCLHHISVDVAMAAASRLPLKP